MDAPVTHREMNTALELWAGAIIEKVTEKISASLAEQEKRLRNSILKAVDERVGEAEDRLLKQLASLSRSNYDDTIRAITGVDDKYKDIPIRVTRLENKVFAPRKQRRTTAARRKRS